MNMSSVVSASGEHQHHTALSTTSASSYCCYCYGIKLALSREHQAPSTKRLSRTQTLSEADTQPASQQADPSDLAASQAAKLAPLPSTRQCLTCATRQHSTAQHSSAEQVCNMHAPQLGVKCSKQPVLHAWRL
jgi:hypothetical protein